MNFKNEYDKNNVRNKKLLQSIFFKYYKLSHPTEKLQTEDIVFYTCSDCIYYGFKDDPYK